jgi:hypothetical protein
MDDLFLALVQRGAAQNLERQARALASPQPLRELWAVSSDRAGTTLSMEFSALANHRKAIRTALGTYAEEFRRRQSEALTTVLEGYGIDPVAFPPDALLFAFTSFSRLLVIEEALGMTSGHAEIRALVDRYLDHYEGTAG